MAKVKAQSAGTQTVPVEEVPEVAAFQEVKNRFVAFKQANPQFFEFLENLAEEYNDKLESASKAVRDRGVRCGDFDLYQWAEKINAEQLYQSLGYEGFLAAGGKMSTVTVYEADKNRVKSSIASGKISQEIAEAVFKREPRFHKPEKVNLP